jgi:hypothetical protein
MLIIEKRQNLAINIDAPMLTKNDKTKGNGNATLPQGNSHVHSQ